MEDIFLFGGGEMEEDSLLRLFEKMFSSFPDKERKVLFVPTASHDSSSYCASFKSGMEKIGVEAYNLLLTKKDSNPYKIMSFLGSCPFVFIGGGDTLFLFEVFKKTRFDSFLKEKLKSGMILSGLSAGAIITMKEGYSDSLIIEGKGGFTFLKGLSYLPFIYNPHGEEEERKGFKEAFLKEKKEEIGLSQDNHTLLHFSSGLLKGAYKSEEDKRAYFIKEGKEEEISLTLI